MPAMTPLKRSGASWGHDKADLRMLQPCSSKTSMVACPLASWFLNISITVVHHVQVENKPMNRCQCQVMTSSRRRHRRHRHHRRRPPSFQLGSPMHTSPLWLHPSPAQVTLHLRILQGH